MKVLIVEDDNNVKDSLENFLINQLGFQVVSCPGKQKAAELLQKNSFNLIFVDVCLMDGSGIDLVEESREHISDSTKVVMISGYKNFDVVIRALRNNVFDFILKPIEFSYLTAAIERARKSVSLTEHKDRATNNDSEDVFDYNHIKVAGRKIGVFSQEMRKIVNFANKLHFDPSINVLVEGETGTGKDIIARIVHYGEEDTGGPFIGLNCSAMNENLIESELFGYDPGSFTGASRSGKAGKIELANKGTLFLDEIAEIPLNIQAKLLTVLEKKEFFRIGGVKRIVLSFRLISASNKCIKTAVCNKEFRNDLFFRINTAHIYLPPLRERKSEIIPLAQLFLLEFSHKKKIPLKFLSNDTSDLLISHHWPGNIRELRNLIERLYYTVNSQVITKKDIRKVIEGYSIGKNKDDNSLTIDLDTNKANLYLIQKQVAVKALGKFKGNKTKTAEFLGISLNKLKRIIGS